MNELKQNFEELYKNGVFEEVDHFLVYRKRINDFYDHLYAKKTKKRFQDRKLVLVPWKMIGVLVDMDYRSVRDFALHGKNPHKATWKKLKPLLDLLEEKENQK